MSNGRGEDLRRESIVVVDRSDLLDEFHPVAADVVNAAKKRTDQEGARLRCEHRLQGLEAQRHIHADTAVGQRLASAKTVHGARHLDHDVGRNGQQLFRFGNDLVVFGRHNFPAHRAGNDVADFSETGMKVNAFLCYETRIGRHSVEDAHGGRFPNLVDVRCVDIQFHGTHDSPDVRIIAAMPGVAQRLAELGIVLPEPPKPIASYVPARLVGNLLYVSGQLPLKDGSIACKGAVPSAVSIEEANAAARQCGLNALAVAADTLRGGLDRVISVVQVRISVASDAGFGDQPAVANGASDLFQEVFGEAGRHTRVAVGAIALPAGVSVEVDVVFEVEPNDG